MRYLLQQLLGFLELGADVVAGQEDLGGALGIGLLHGRVAVGRRQHEAIDAQLGQVGEQLIDLVEIGFLVDGRVGADEEAGLLGGDDALDGGLEDPVAFDGQVVRLLPDRRDGR